MLPWTRNNYLTNSNFSRLFIRFRANMKTMNNYDIIEISKIYKRIMEVELTLKSRIEYALCITFPNSMFSVLIPFLQRISHKNYIQTKKTKEKEQQRDKINDIIHSKSLNEEQKLKKFIGIVYLSDVLKIITEFKSLYKNKVFMKNLYLKDIDLNYMKSYQIKLCELRNAVMHFNIEKYIQNKVVYIEALSYWERLLFCSNYQLQQLPKVKPTTMNILEMIEKEMPEVLEMSDRVVCDIFDDIAYINGFPLKKLPLYWTIGRQIYELKSKITKEKENIKNIENGQLFLLFDTSIQEQ